jgi:hypothetical protein
MKIQFALCAQTASVDRASNRLSIFNVFDQFPVSSFPIVIPSVTFVSVIESEETENNNIRGAIEIEANRVKVFGIEVPINFTSNRLARVVLTFQGIPVGDAGPLTFRLTLPDGTIAETTFQVINVASREAIQLTSLATPDSE